MTDETSPRAHVLIRRDGRVTTGILTHVSSREQFRGETEVGRTQHVVVFSDGTAEGNAAARAVLATAEADYEAVQAWFGGINLPPGQPGDDQSTPRTATPVQVLVDPQAGGAYHFGCPATDIYIEPTAQVASGLMVAELVEIFEAAINNGWACGQANGEALSRVLAVERNAALGTLVAETAQSWWANGHVDYVTNNDADDRNQDSNGCGSLFLYYLHTQLGFSWRQIVATGGATLGLCYQKLTGKDPAQGFSDFVALLGVVAQNGQLNVPQSGNPFPIGGVTQPVSGDTRQVGGIAAASTSLASRGGMLIALVILVLLALIGVLVGSGYVHL